MRACAEVNQAMLGLEGVKVQHWGTKQRHDQGLTDSFSYLREQNTFSNDPSLQNIPTRSGEHALSNVNVDTAQSVGTMMLESMDLHMLSAPSSAMIKMSLLA